MMTDLVRYQENLEILEFPVSNATEKFNKWSQNNLLILKIMG